VERTLFSPTRRKGRRISPFAPFQFAWDNDVVAGVVIHLRLLVQFYPPHTHTLLVPGNDDSSSMGEGGLGSSAAAASIASSTPGPSLGSYPGETRRPLNKSCGLREVPTASMVPTPISAAACSDDGKGADKEGSHPTERRPRGDDGRVKFDV